MDKLQEIESELMSDYNNMNSFDKDIWFNHVKWLIDEVKKRENYWVDKHLSSLGENIKLHEDIQIKENHNQLLRKSNREYQRTIETLEEELEKWKREKTAI